MELLSETLNISYYHITEQKKYILMHAYRKIPFAPFLLLSWGVHVKQNEVLQHPSETAADSGRNWALYLVCS